MSAALSRDRLAAFARALARNDRRRRPRTWVDDDEIIGACSGFARCVRVTTRSAVVLTHRDYLFAIGTYRRARGLRKRPNDGVTPLLHVAA